MSVLSKTVCAAGLALALTGCAEGYYGEPSYSVGVGVGYGGYGYYDPFYDPYFGYDPYYYPFGYYGYGLYGRPYGYRYGYGYGYRYPWWRYGGRDDVVQPNPGAANSSGLAGAIERQRQRAQGGD